MDTHADTSLTSETGSESSIRESLETLEAQTLNPLAALSRASRGREKPEDPCVIRTAFQRDRDRILHSKAFRRLKHKTQVFIAPEGDHYRTRLTHSLEVAQVSRTIARALRLNEDLAESIALGHDLGHPPFGHTGENVLNKLFAEGFHHQQQSLRIIRLIEPMNLTLEVIDGIEGSPYLTLEAQIVDTADRMAYLHHDVEDAIRAGLMSEADLPAEVTELLGRTKQERLNTMILDMIRQSLVAMREETPRITMSANVTEAMFALRRWMFSHVYLTDERQEQARKVHRLISGLFEHFREHPEGISENIPAAPTLERRVVDYIAGMTDRYAIHVFQQHCLPRPFQSSDEACYLP